MEFLRRFLSYKNGIPSHDALNDLISALNPGVFSGCFVSRVSGLRDGDPRHRRDRRQNRPPHALQIQGTPAAASGLRMGSPQWLVLGQEARDVKSNEITVIPLLLRRLELKGALFAIDAMGKAGQRFRQA
jgi:hypothetical protein